MNLNTLNDLYKHAVDREAIGTSVRNEGHETNHER